MAGLDIHGALAKWLKKAKLRDGSHNVVFHNDSFYYRGFAIGEVETDHIKLKWPATLRTTLEIPEGSIWGPTEELMIADPKFFTKLRKAFRYAMTAVNEVSIDISQGFNGPGGRQQSGTKQ